MDAAATAINKLLSGSGQQKSTAPATQQETAPAASTKVDTTTTGGKDTTVEQVIAPAVEKETVRREHETREQTVVDRERHQDHYHTTIQPLQDLEVEPTRHDHKTEAVEQRQINNDSQGKAVKAQVAAERNQFKSTTSEAATKESKAKEETIEHETVHHHLHETIQPVIEKERVIPEVTHVKKPVHEVVKEQSVNLGVTKAKPMSVDQFQGKLSGESKTEVVHNGGHEVSAKTAATTKEEGHDVSAKTAVTTKED